MLIEYLIQSKQKFLSDAEHITASGKFVTRLVPDDYFSISAGFRIHVSNF